MIQYYNDRAEEYDDIYSGKGPASCKPEVSQKDILELQKLLSEFGTGNVIYIGCGTVFWLKYYYHNCEKFTFLDVAPNMLQKCRAQVEKCGVQDNATYIQEDFLHWDIPSLHEYDCIFTGFLLGHFMTVQEEAFFQKITQILKPGGTIFILDNTWPKWRGKDEHEDIFHKYNLKIVKIYWGLNFFGMIGKLV